MTDMSSAYMAYRGQAAAGAAVDELEQFARGATSERAGNPAAPATVPTSIGSIPADSKLARTAYDIGIGAVETPRAIVKGVRDAYQNTLNIGKELGGWLEQNNLGGGIIIDKSGVRLASGKELSNPDLVRPADYATMPDINAPKTVTGGLVKGVAQFLVGMKGAGKLLEVAGAPAAAGAAGYGLNALKGAIANFAAFDPHQQRLSNLIEKFPALQNPVTEFLASDPSDTAAEGRFKNALEGLGLGVLTDGFFKGVKLLREAAKARTAADSVDEAAAAAANAPRQLPENAFRDLGNEAPNAPLVKAPKASNATVGDVANAAKGGGDQVTPQTYINFARVDSPEDVQRVMQKLADMGPPAADEARAGVRSFATMKLDAAHKDAWELLVNRREGAPLSDAESLAARELWTAATDKVTRLAETAAANPSEENLFAFRKMLEVHDMIQRQVLGARAATARALGSWRIPAGGPAERMQQVQQALEANGGSDVSRELAQRVSALAKAGMVKELQGVVEKGAYATTRDAVVEAWINGLLSNPTTHMANTLSNTSVVFLRMAERGIAAKISSLLGDEGGVAAGEATAQWFGLTQGLKDAFRYAVKAARTGESGYGLGKIEGPRAGAISSEAFKLGSDTTLGRGVDALGAVVRLPGRALSAEDEFFKTVGYRMELSAQALRQATSEMPDAAPAALKQRVAQIIQNPPENIRLAAIDAATYQTFTNAPGKLAQSLGQLTSHYPALKVILPFTRTPANILNFTFERTPLAPLMSRFRADIAAGGARRDLALAQVSLGTGAMLSFADMTMNGQITGRGPVEKGERDAMAREGWKPYSFKIGDRWVTYNRLDPVGSLVGMSADATEMLMQAQHDALDDPDTERLAVATALAFAGNITNKTYLSGLSSIIEALNDPQRAAQSWTQGLAGSVIPAAVAQAARLEDPVARQVNSMMDAIRARTPGLSDKLPPRRDLWGEPIRNESGSKAWDAFSPLYSPKPSPEPIDQEILRLDSNVTMPQRRTSFNGVTVDLSQYGDAYSRYVELAGNGLKNPAWGLGAKDLLNKIVTGQHPLSAVYRLKTDGPEGGKDVFIRDTIRQYRELARTQLLKEYPKLAADVREKQAQQRALKLPVLQ